VDRAPLGVEEQDSQVVKLPLAEALALVEKGEILDAKSMLGLLSAWKRLE
jgi:hypothetical protein